ncbi:DUF397 domain-containing protein [Spirillospora sp. NPDC052242]
MRPEFTSWRKSSYSDPDGKCVEVGRGPGGTVGVRDTKEQGTGPILEFTQAEWTAFLNFVQMH